MNGLTPEAVDRLSDHLQAAVEIVQGASPEPDAPAPEVRLTASDELRHIRDSWFLGPGLGDLMTVIAEELDRSSPGFLLPKDISARLKTALK